MLQLGVPVVNPTRAFSPPSNPAIHQTLMGPSCRVGIPSGQRTSRHVMQHYITSGALPPPEESGFSS